MQKVMYQADLTCISQDVEQLAKLKDRATIILNTLFSWLPSWLLDDTNAVLIGLSAASRCWPNGWLMPWRTSLTLQIKRFFAQIWVDVSFHSARLNGYTGIIVEIMTAIKDWHPIVMLITSVKTVIRCCHRFKLLCCSCFKFSNQSAIWPHMFFCWLQIFVFFLMLFCNPKNVRPIKNEAQRPLYVGKNKLYILMACVNTKGFITRASS